jgi:hypothetical protein
MSIEQQVDLRVPTLQSMYHIKWSGDVPVDIDYPEPESDESDGSSEEWEAEEWEGAPESLPESDEEEDPNSEDSEGYVLIVFHCALLIPISRQELALTEGQIDMLQTHIAEFRVAPLQHRLAIVKVCLAWIQERWQSDATFNRKQVETVCPFRLYWTSLIPSSLFASTCLTRVDG